MALVVDDHLLIVHLAGMTVGWLAQQVAESAVYTTGGWYYRVASASGQDSGNGALSRRIGSLPEPDQHVLRSKIAALPGSIGLIGPRLLVPIMAGLRTPRRLNYLSSEALALAIVAEAMIAVRTDSPPLREACRALHVDYRVVDAP